MTNISVSDMNSYLTCRRAWDLTSSNRQSLRHKVTPKVFFVIGSAVHEAIDAQAAGKDPYESFEQFVSRERRDREAAYKEAVGKSPWNMEMEEFEASVDLARGLVDQYFLHYSTENPLADLGLKYVATEVPFSIPLESGDVFVGTWDGVATDIATESKFYLTENKTAARKPKMDNFGKSNQVRGYSWAFRTLTGIVPAGLVYNGLIKRLIKPPKRLKSGALSVDKNQSTTFQAFLTELQRGGDDPVKYEEYMQFLMEREANGDDRFFYREMFHPTNAELDNWHDQVLEPTVNEMNGREMVNELSIIPNYTSCDNCLVQDICAAMDHDEDVAAVVSARYEVGTYGTKTSVDGATSVPVGSAEELVEYLKGVKNG